MRDCERLSYGLNIHLNKKQIKTADQLSALHDRWIIILNNKIEHDAEKILYPPAPIQGNEMIRPIKNLAELQREGKEMHHCVASYSRAILDGQCYVYKVIAPQRATLEIRLKDGIPSIEQCKLKNNMSPNQETFLAIRRWYQAFMDEKKTMVI